MIGRLLQSCAVLVLLAATPSSARSAAQLQTAAAAQEATLAAARARGRAAAALDSVAAVGDYPLYPFIVYTFGSKHCEATNFQDESVGWSDSAGYPSVAANEQFYLTDSAAERGDFYAAMAAGAATSLTISGGVDTYRAACEAQDGQLFPMTTTFSIGEAAFDIADVVCIAEVCCNCMDTRDIPSFGLFGIPSLWDSTMCAMYETISANVTGCETTTDITPYYDPPYTDSQLYWLCAAVGAVFIVAALAVYLPRFDPATKMTSSRAMWDSGASSIDVPLIDDYARLPKDGASSAKPPQDPHLDQSWGARVRRAWDPWANLQSLTKAGRLAPLDGIRALSLLWVIGLHSSTSAPQGNADYLAWVNSGFATPTYPGAAQYDKLNDTWIMRWMQGGDLAVDCFFVLSGFLIAYQLFREADRGDGTFNPLKFLLRRLLRLWPALAWAVAWQTQMYPGTNDVSCKDLGWLKTLTFTNAMLDGVDSCIGQSWSVGVEMSMYILSVPIVGLMLMDYKRARFLRSRYRGAFVLVMLGLASMTMRGLFVYNCTPSSGAGASNPQYWWWVAYFSVALRIGPYLAGMCVALLYREHTRDADRGRTSLLEKVDGKLKVALDLLAIAAVVSISYVHVEQIWGSQLSWSAGVAWPMYVAGRVVFALGVAHAMAQMLSGRWTHLAAVLSLPPLVVLAKLSYSTYLFQFSLISEMLEFWTLNGAVSLFQDIGLFIWVLTGIIGGSLVYGFVTYMLVEAPIMKLRPV